MGEKRVHLRFRDRTVRLHGVLCNHVGAAHATDDRDKVTCNACRNLFWRLGPGGLTNG
jgi:hypothetical protein